MSSEQLLFAVHNGDLREIENYFESVEGADPDLIDHEGITFELNEGAPILLIAARQNHLDVVEFLIRKCANVNLGKTDSRASALLVAAQEGHLDCVLTLLQSGAAHCPTDNGLSPLFSAARHRHRDVVSALLSAGASAAPPCSRPDPNSRPAFPRVASVDGLDLLEETALKKEAEVERASSRAVVPLVVREGQIDLLDDFVSHFGIDVQALDAYGKSLIAAGVVAGHVDVLIALLAAYAGHVDQTSDDGRTGLHHAAILGRVDLALVLVLAGADLQKQGRKLWAENPLYYIVAEDRIDLFSMLVNSGAQFNRESEVKSNTPFLLYLAARHDSLDSAVALLSMGATLYYRDGTGKFPLHEAAKSRSFETLRLLLEVGYDPNLGDDRGGSSALFSAIYSGFVSGVSYLLQFGADVNHTTDPNDGQRTPLFLACRWREWDVAIALLAAGADIERANVFVPLRMSQNDLGFVSLLLACDANPDTRLDDGRTPLHLAAKENSLTILGLLLKYGANVEHRADDGSTALHCACIDVHPEVVTVLLQAGANPRILTLQSSPLLGLGGKTPVEVAPVDLQSSLRERFDEWEHQWGLSHLTRLRLVCLIFDLPEATLSVPIDLLHMITSAIGYRWPVV